MKEIKTYDPVAVKVRTGGPYLSKPPKDEASQNKLGDALREWVKSEDVFAIEDFPISLSMSPNRFYKLAETNEYFADCLDIARKTIGSRLQRGWRERTLDKDYVLRILLLYNDEYKKITLDKMRVIEDSKAQATQFNITMNPIPADK